MNADKKMAKEARQDPLVDYVAERIASARTGDKRYVKDSDYIHAKSAVVFVRERLAEEIEADAGIETHPWLVGMKRAARIVRGASADTDPTQEGA